jgi:hypothetical protein
MPIKVLPVPTGLSPALVEQLATLHVERSGVAEVKPAMRREDLQRLGALGVIEPVDASSETPREVSVTEYGRGVIAGCADHMQRTGPRQVYGDLAPP